MKSELAIYAMQILSIQGIFYIVYRLFLSKSRSHSFGRGYLLTTLMLAFVIPQVTIPIERDPAVFPESGDVVHWAEKRIGAYDLVNEKDESVVASAELSIWDVLPWIYGAITLYLLGRGIMYLVVLQKVKRRSEYIEGNSYQLFRTSETLPFSFLRSVFIPRELFGTIAFEPILEHECAHVKKGHSFDRLLVDLAVALLWFNPFMYLYRKALIEIHEYQADEAVINRFGDPIGYQEILYAQLQTAAYPGMVSHFNFSIIKKRIVMINTQKKKRTWFYACTIPVILLVTLGFAGKMDTQLNYVEQELNSKIDSETIIAGPAQDQFTPSILPLKDPKEMRISSRYGRKRDPIDHEDKMHTGLDLKVPLNTVVISTAKGVVHQSGYHKNYGNYVLIDHGDRYMTRYAHLSSFEVERGDSVNKGQEIGLTGNTGRSTGPHLHYEVIEVDSGHKNPLNYIKDYQFEEKSASE